MIPLEPAGNRRPFSGAEPIGRAKRAGPVSFTHFGVALILARSPTLVLPESMRLTGEALTFDDVLLVPAYSEVLPRDVSLATRLTRDID
ncbi:MAG: IMP dehydrogenase, partial [bacterium]